MRKIYLTAMLAIVLPVVAAGCGRMMDSPGVSAPAALENRELATRLVQEDWDAFANFFRADFSQRVSDEFIPDKAGFINAVEESFYQTTPIDLSFTLNEVLEQEDKLAVSVSWQKKSVERSSGELVLRQGEGLMVYVNENGQWRIYQVQGQPIFF